VSPWLGGQGQWHPGGLYPRAGLLVTSLGRDEAERANAVRHQLHLLACNLSTFLRTLVLPPEVEQWSLDRDPARSWYGSAQGWSIMPTMPCSRGREHARESRGGVEGPQARGR